MRFDSGRVLVCAALFAAGLPSTVSAFDKTWSNNSDWSQGAENHVNHTDVPDQIQLNKDTQEEIFTPFIWIANSGSNTVAKMDTRNGSHYPGSPYPVCSNPSRTAVDMEGNCWVGCRNDGRVMKLDKDTGRVLVDVKPGGNVIRAVAIDAEGYVWVGAWDMHRMYKLNPNTGQTMKIVDNVTCPYGAAADRVGRIWAVGSWCSEAGSGRLTLISSSGTIIRTWNSSIGNLYGIGIDSHNHAWVGAWQSRAVVEFDPNSPNPVRTISLAGVGRGVAIDGFDNVWVAMSDNKSDTNQVAKLNRAAGFSVSYVNVGTGPVGVAVDQDNNVWVVNMGSATVTKIRASDSQVIGTYATKGTGPYTYSDMTGFQLQSIAKPAVGTWTVQFNAGCPAWWRSINWKASTPAGTSVKLRARTAGSRPGLATASWSGPYTVPGSTLSVPDNAWIEIQVELSSNDASSVVPSVQELTITYNGRPEQCDGLDNDCNGVPDDGLTRSCRTACGTGTETCVNGTWQNCDAPPVLPEVCDYRDNDCDGDIDEGVQNACGECGEVPEETCNGIDDDCDGTIDEGCQCIAGQTRACGTDEGECSSGIQECKELPDGSTYWDTECIGEVPPAEEVCDGLDNDCDGRVDEGCDCVTGETRPCGSDVGACRPGIQICDDQGRWGECVGYIEPAQEVCDCFDNDCDGEVDEGDLCPGGSVCAECKCADPCVFGECPAGKQCINGYCVPIDCSQVQCDQGYVCKWGLCVPSCEGVECPDGKTCLDGTCVYDDCRSLGCPAGQRCVAKKCEKDRCYGVECNEG